MKNKFVAIALALTTLVWAFPISAATTAELQAQIAALLQQISALQAQLGGTTPSTTTSSCFTKTLKLGMTDAEVTALQNALKGNAAIYPSGLVTGYFGSLTQAAVQKFQAANGIVSSGTPATTGYGLVGPSTRAKLNALYCTTGTTPTGTTTPTPVGGGVSVMLATDTPAAASVITDTADGAQALAPFTKLVFTAGTTAAKVTGIKLVRSGVSTNSDISNVYLYEGNTRLAEMVSITSDNVITFSNSAGLFTVPAGSSKTITVKADLANAGSAGKTMRLGVNAAADITVEGATAAGTFPINGNYMTWASITDLGKYTFFSSTYPSAVDPSATAERELWRLSSTAQNQKVQLQYMKFTMIGTASNVDFSNLKLTIGSTVYGPVEMAADKTVTFDLSATPFVYEAGQTKNIALSGKVIGGASRNFYFTLQNASDVVAYDLGYNVYLKPNPNKLDTYTVIKAAAATNINSGSLTISKASDTPLGSLPLGATNVELARFNFVAAGEAIKVSSLAAKLTCSLSPATTVIKNVKLYVDGSQIGSTDSEVTCNSGTDTDKVAGLGSLSNSLVINAGQTRVVSIKADLTQTAAEPAALDTIMASLVTVTDGYTRMSAGTTGTVTGQDGNALTLRSGTISVTKNVSVPDGSASNPTGVVGGTEVKIGSFAVNAGLGEAVDVTQLVIKDAAGTFDDHYSNLKLKDSAGNQIGSTYGTLTDATNYSFVPTTAIRINVGQQAVFNIYADILSTVAAGTTSVASVDAVYATGVTTSQTADYTTPDIALQKPYIAGKGSLTVSLDSATPISQQIVAGKTYELGRFKFAAGTSEDVRVTDFVVNLNSSTSSDIADLSEFRLYDVTGGAKTLVAGPVYSVTADATTSWDGYVTFTGFSNTITKSTNKIYSVEAKVSAWTLGQSANTQQLMVRSDYLAAAGTSTPVTAYGNQSNATLAESDGSLVITGTNVTANEMKIYRTKIAAAMASDTPSGATTPSATHQIAKFVVSNEANDGSYSANVNSMVITINATNLTENATASRTFTLYKDSVNSSNKVAEATLSSSSGGVYGGTITFGAATTTTTFSGYTVTAKTNFASTEIAAGGSKTFILVADTTTPKTTNNATSYINPTIKAAGITWADGDTSTGTSITDVDTLPLDSSSKTLSW